MSHVKCWDCGKSGHYGRDCSEMWWSRDQGKSKGKGKLNNAESSYWQEGWLEGKPQSYREQDEAHVHGRWKTTDWQAGKRRWQRPREETASVRTREEGARVQENQLRRSSAQFICDSRDECTDKEKTNSDQPRQDRSEESVATRSTARHEDLHRRLRRHRHRRVRQRRVEKGKKSARPECRQQTCRTCAKKQIECAYESICSHWGQKGIQVVKRM